MPIPILSDQNYFPINLFDLNEPTNFLLIGGRVGGVQNFERPIGLPSESSCDIELAQRLGKLLVRSTGLLVASDVNLVMNRV